MFSKGIESLFHISQEENIGNVSVKICIFAQLLGGWLNVCKLTDWFPKEKPEIKQYIFYINYLSVTFKACQRTH